MNGKQAIKKLKILKKVQPNQFTLNNIQKRVHKRMEKEYAVKTPMAYSWRSSYSVFGIIGIIVIIVLLFGRGLMNQNQMHEIVLTSKIALASDRYEKANIALSDTSSRYPISRPVSAGSVEDISRSLNTTNNQMSLLKLKGEPGKYSSKQCLMLYQQYLYYLTGLDTQIQNSQNFSLTSLKSQIASYREQIEMKLQMYQKL